MLADSSLVDRIYSASIVPEEWPAVLDALCVAAEAAAGGLLAFGAAGARGLGSADYSPAMQSYFERGLNYPNVRPERSLRDFPMGFATDLDVCSLEELSTDPIYRDFMQPFGFAWSSGTVIPSPTGDMLVFDFLRRLGEQPFQRQAMERLDRLRPHLARAALLSQRLGLAAARSAADALQAVGLPAAVLGGSGCVLAANALLDTFADRIRIGAFDQISLATPGADAMLQQALATGSEAVTRSIALPAGAGSVSLVLHVVPVRRTARDIFVGVSALLLVTPVTAPAAPLTEVLTALFDLTPAEARVARSLAAGQSLNGIAARFGVSRETTRSQLKAVFGKVGVSSQVELVRLLSGIAPIP